MNEVIRSYTVLDWRFLISILLIIAVCRTYVTYVFDVIGSISAPVLSSRDACHMKTCYGPASLPFKNLWLSDWASLPSSQFTKFLISFRFCSCWSRHFQLPGLLSFWLCVWVSEEWAVHLIQLPRGKSSTSRMWIKQSR